MIFSWFPVVAHLTTTSVPCAPPNYLPLVPDTETVTSFAPVLLTPELVTSYATVETALNAYLTAHPHTAATVRAHGRSITVARIDLANGVSSALTMMDPGYPTLVQHDTALAGIFTRQRFDPAQYMPVMKAVWGAIGLAVSGKTADTATVTGKNVVFVQAHQPVLATDWQQFQSIKTLYEKNVDKAMQEAQQGANDQDRNP